MYGKVVVDVLLSLGRRCTSCLFIMIRSKELDDRLPGIVCEGNYLSDYLKISTDKLNELYALYKEKKCHTLDLKGEIDNYNNTIEYCNRRLLQLTHRLERLKDYI